MSSEKLALCLLLCCVLCRLGVGAFFHILESIKCFQVSTYFWEPLKSLQKH
jgi:hypothetical protein